MNQQTINKFSPENRERMIELEGMIRERDEEIAGINQMLKRLESGEKLC